MSDSNKMEEEQPTPSSTSMMETDTQGGLTREQIESMVSDELEGLGYDFNGMTPEQALAAMEAELSDTSDDEEDIPTIQLTGDYTKDRALLTSFMEGGNGEEDEDMSISEPPRTTHEVSENELPPLPSLESLSIPNDSDLSPAGAVLSIVNKIIVIAGPFGARAVEPGTPLYLEDRSPIGVVEDVFGQVESPYYSIRLESADTATTHPTMQEGSLVFLSPEKSTYILAQKLRVPGSDASNAFDEEIPIEKQEFSDDEKELEMKKAAKNLKKKNAKKNSEGASNQRSKGGNGNLNRNQRRPNTTQNNTQRQHNPTSISPSSSSSTGFAQPFVPYHTIQRPPMNYGMPPQNMYHPQGGPVPIYSSGPPPAGYHNQFAPSSSSSSSSVSPSPSINQPMMMNGNGQVPPPYFNQQFYGQPPQFQPQPQYGNFPPHQQPQQPPFQNNHRQ